MYLFVGGALYLVGSLLVTIVFNVPKNEALAAVAPAGPDGASQLTSSGRRADAEALQSAMQSLAAAQERTEVRLEELVVAQAR